MRVRWACLRCRATGTTRLGVSQVWHECRPPRGSRRTPVILDGGHFSREEYLDRQRQAWADRVLSDSPRWLTEWLERDAR